MNKRTRYLLGIGVIAALVLGWQIAAFAVHDTTQFELDGNATNNAAVAGDDWDNVCHQVTGSDCSTTNNTTGASAVDWVAEPDLNASIFTGGGSKDPQDLNQWAWKNGSSPDKDNLQHSFAARYTGTTGTYQGDDLLFFGSDRIDNSGDAQQGFWFFQNAIGLNGGNVGGGTGFTGQHKAGDVLVVSDFSNGGTTSTITVYSWNPACTKAGQVIGTGQNAKTCGDANLLIQGTSTSANCATSAANDQFCGIVNSSTITMPWTFTDKSGTPNNQALNGEFFEGGVNLTDLGLGGKCFSSVASETRSSTSTTAVLKDFILGNFGKCQTTVKTTPKTAAGGNITAPLAVGDTAKDEATITVTGASTFGGTVSFHLCGPLTTAAGCATGGTAVLQDKPVSTTTGSVTVLSDASAPLTQPGFYCWRANFEPDATSLANGVTAGVDASTTECFNVKDTSAITTTQKWLPQDEAAVTKGSGGAAPAGTVVFSLYENGTCSGTAATTFTDTTAPYATDNATYRTANTTISWSATYTPTDTNAISGSTTTRCERSDLTINNSATAFPPAP